MVAMKNIAVTGYTGFIGSHVVKALIERGYNPNRWWNSSAFAVIHCAAMANIPDSFSYPVKCYDTNVGMTIDLIKRMKENGVNNIIFLSTNTIEGNHPYGRSKKMCEQIIQDSGLRYVILRYFNVSGSDPDIKKKWRPNYRLIPMLLNAAKTGEAFTLYGDGRQVRDYIHVTDATAITMKALKNLEEERDSYLSEVGTGEGHSIKEVIEMVEKVTEKKINIVNGGERKGDIDRLIAEKPDFELNHSSLENIVRTAWNNVCSHQA